MSNAHSASDALARREAALQALIGENHFLTRQAAVANRHVMRLFKVLQAARIFARDDDLASVVDLVDGYMMSLLDRSAFAEGTDEAVAINSLAGINICIAQDDPDAVVLHMVAPTEDRFYAMTKADLAEFGARFLRVANAPEDSSAPAHHGRGLN